ncbi:alpha/beta hydrolase [Ornithinimicrobium ciconiae]|uniref:Alpha/beta hydrolase n=1 Tax=Ornithinimicrobium ciconiae TaxID=2594265 RepID=A0A516G7Y9_9MICO|nr:alpha/beta hydrolase [Ornithinimicrobium ciconiae]QDO87638.1 alpha/beta hydrolase [Ornithinimicrobium ciconiae]
MVTAARTSRMSGPTGELEILTAGRGQPHTVLAHGLAGSIPTTRPYATAVPGARTFLHFRGHGNSASPDGPWEYAGLAAELWAVADHVGASQALGISMGAGALCAGLVSDPDRFDRLVLVLPAAIDRPRDDTAMRRLGALADLVDSRDQDAVAAHLLGSEPASVRAEPAVQQWARGQAARLVGTDVARALRTLPALAPLPDRAMLAHVTAPVLLLAQQGDPTHPESVARELAEVLPGAILQVLPPGGIMWEHRSRVRDLVGAFLTPASTTRQPTPGESA